MVVTVDAAEIEEIIDQGEQVPPEERALAEETPDRVSSVDIDACGDCVGAAPEVDRYRFGDW